MKQGARSVAARVIQDVANGRALDSALDDRSSDVSDNERALVAEMAYGVCRWNLQLDAMLDQLLDKRLKSSKQLVEQLLKVGLYQLFHMRIPAHAAVDETVKASVQLKQKWATRLVNAILRRAQREQQELLQKLEADSVIASGLPEWLYGSLSEQYPEQVQEIGTALLQRPPMTLRINSRLTTVTDYAESLVRAGMTSRPVEHVPQALVLDQPVSVDKLPGFDKGLVSVQDAGAQLAALFLEPQPGDTVLDACAAPGGKSCHLLELQPECSLTAVDVEQKRLQLIHDNLQRLGLEADVLQLDMSEPGDQLSDAGFDRILLDVPCSATGVMRRHPDIRLLRRKSDIAPLIMLQANILRHAWSLLRPGGRLLYATCSLLPGENWQQVSAFIDDTPDAAMVQLSHPAGIECSHGIQILPGSSGMDGFYYALMEKHG
ncbi:16S rRNA (cytosine(967)-C(5))-methyltransferase RsmB [Solemya velum gill symbiont]|uniref:16S rRNA (cytosine(967)-C(5))-methyltransferase RsmB n=1 Tax=Solemya velum gill symbiont TaxID=2340 RepID=UPI0009D064A3|nr:16S rRNA (cytosine(967)-C(5))-methyltransferase RsmB [Solemya velum gill symbiont]OOZ23367.1 16S rRNA (cytosine(967)-C(5))-methyltransferase [Solemya velum gill symbiont]OOZ25452.1 16S rRNA (cytosine(967)-C(5))-methyltransferase [Solemya velum gill symbiont]OOZ29105.1 16S rRNA (cytosine(967)-C(5))-methyltransferase [Solemya velum gill symbiont]OOZ32894.1 16S rRNA (cytosine(967)-C(5))-methyltransferase [Solemya velum gill symbiont]OOZ35119.1 16S rRNA (cytosine(967)-C(5))-methyltransferase [S